MYSCNTTNLKIKVGEIMGSMMDDINKFSKIWDNALESGIFKDETSKETKPDDQGSDFFGNFRSDDYDIDQPLNESDIKNWNDIIKSTGGNQVSKSILKQNQNVAGAMGKSPNPLYPYSVGMDQEIQKWDSFCEKMNLLDQAKQKLYNLESSLNSLLAAEGSEDSNSKANENPQSGAKTKRKKPKNESKIDKLQKDMEKLRFEIHQLSDHVTGKFETST